MRKLGIAADVSNLYHCVHHRYGKKVSYSKYMAFCRDIGTVMMARAYGASSNGEAKAFIHALETVGFNTRFKQLKVFASGERKADWDVGITLDVVNTHSQYDTLLLGSADSDMAELVDWLSGRGVQTIVLACGISHELKVSAFKAIEIPESLLE